MVTFRLDACPIARLKSLPGPGGLNVSFAHEEEEEKLGRGSKGWGLLGQEGVLWVEEFEDSSFRVVLLIQGTRFGYLSQEEAFQFRKKAQEEQTWPFPVIVPIIVAEGNPLQEDVPQVRIPISLNWDQPWVYLPFQEGAVANHYKFECENENSQLNFCNQFKQNIIQKENIAYMIVFRRIVWLVVLSYFFGFLLLLSLLRFAIH